MTAVFQFGVLLLLLGCVQCQEQIFNDNSLMVETYGRDMQKINDPLFACNICKKILQKIFDSIGKQLSKDKVDTAINKVCQKLKLINAPCMKFVKKYKDKLVRAITSEKNAPAACKRLKLCKKTSIYSP
ncbi:antimicrobial peptide NK-lysin-like [Silurus asotus]|uniref:Antimicrobial peptide NK-lysin-like n=1 Tax=Silurus asotus TaxID=30991 RepID=A0AAD5ATT9_SILAS|nr:antimicrobial peptide NK-lysin-like [Silurus asotus]